MQCAIYVMRRLTWRAATKCTRHTFYGFTCSRFISAKGDSSESCPFAVLGLDKKSDEATVRARYRDLVKQHHPDVGGDATKFREVTNAYKKCLDLIEFRDGQQPEGGTAQGGGDSEEDIDRHRREYMRHKHREIRELFHAAKTLAEVETTLTNVFCTLRRLRGKDEDYTECLVLCIENVTRVMSGKLGHEHLDVCFGSIRAWEAEVHRSVAREIFHNLLTLYGGDFSLGVMDSMEVTTQATRILDEMRDRGIESDDWTMYLASRIFRTSPYPDW